jgi:hypothetical protein
MRPGSQPWSTSFCCKRWMTAGSLTCQVWPFESRTSNAIACVPPATGWRSSMIAVSGTTSIDVTMPAVVAGG